ncbi:PEP-CTERM sorting domain-containing protein [Luteolibacter pohnpeiensis]|uniref:PEP-CTERM sorting domain-containing protein n=1 Tax=Luteolibacter pohnpeiensis TaxID=454153 RepID=A0A934SCC6_9BACT|nr:PEP-CTERM sorting domain-containing protein [Luteolibacter pohnpeiensis]MBK1883557.1 PEP-CTERM sorting domain-containing protein [Luteolibacter pohnpeiensis]
MKTKLTFLTLGLMLGVASLANATIIGFSGLGDSNTAIGLNYASNASSDGTGYTVSNGSTSNIAVTWGGASASATDSSWDIHHSTWFTPIEGQTTGDSTWDGVSSSPDIAQLDYGNVTITFTVDSGYALVLNSFDFGQTAETSGTSSWTLSLTNSSLTTVWSQTVDFTDGQVYTISPAFTGEDGETYTLTFNRTAESYSTNGRLALDNLSFNQVAIPEPSTVALFGLAGLGLLRRRRK